MSKECIHFLGHSIFKSGPLNSSLAAAVGCNAATGNRLATHKFRGYYSAPGSWSGPVTWRVASTQT